VSMKVSVQQSTSRVSPHTSHITPHTSHLTPHTSHLTPHTSHLTPHTSQVTHYIDLVTMRCASGAAAASHVVVEIVAAGVRQEAKGLRV
jgi:hypothetical protein